MNNDVTPSGQANLALCYLYAWGGMKNPNHPIAQRNIHSAIREKNGHAHFFLGMSELTLANSLPCNTDRKFHTRVADRHFKKAIMYFIDKDDSTAWVYLGICYEKGYGVFKKMPELAKIHYQKSAEHNNAFAKYLLGHFHLERRRNKEAIVWFKKAAAQKYPGAQYQLDLLRQIGASVASDMIFSRTAMEPAISKNHQLVPSNLSHCHA